MRFDYRGQLGLFDKSPQIVDESGADTNISTVRFKLELSHGLATPGSDLKAFIFHYVPATLLFYPKGQMIKRIY